MNRLKKWKKSIPALGMALLLSGSALAAGGDAAAVEERTFWSLAGQEEWESEEQVPLPEILSFLPEAWTEAEAEEESPWEEAASEEGWDFGSSLPGWEAELVGEGPYEGWSLSLLYFDSMAPDPLAPRSVSEPLVWEADSYAQRRQVGVQVHYACVDAPRAYLPGEVDITVPDLAELFTGGREGAMAVCGAALSADPAGQEGPYPWTYELREGVYHLHNKETLEEKTSFEGTIQLTWNLLAAAGTSGGSFSLRAGLGELLSEPFTLTFSSGEMGYDLSQEPKKLKSLSGLPSGDYIWVQYDLLASTASGTRHLIEGTSYLETDPQPGCLVLDADQNPLSPEEDGSVRIPVQNQTNDYEHTHILAGTYYVGYPAPAYGEAVLEQEARLFGSAYGTDALTGEAGEVLFRAEARSRISVADFVFVYEGDLYRMDKRAENSLLNSDVLRVSEEQAEFSLTGECRYTRGTMRCVFGDDLMGILREGGEFALLEEEKYWVKTLSIPTFSDSLGRPFSDEDLRIRVYIRKRGSSSFEFLGQPFNEGKNYDFPEGEVTAWYVEVDGLQESLVFQGMNSITAKVFFHDEEAGREGSLYNFAYMDVFVDGERDLDAGLENYANDLTRDTIAREDLSRYGRYLYRSAARVDYVRRPNGPFLEMYSDSYSTDTEAECFTSTMTLTLSQKKYRGLSANGAFQGYDAYVLLAPGIQVDGEPYLEPAWDLLEYGEVRSASGETFTQEEYQTFVEDHFSWETAENWRGSGRTLLHLVFDYRDAPLDLSGLLLLDDWQRGDEIYDIYLDFPVSVSFDRYLDLGNDYTSTGKIGEVGVDDQAYLTYPVSMNDAQTDEGFTGVPYSQDVDEDGITQELFGWCQDMATITAVAASHQDLAVLVSTDAKNFHKEEGLCAERGEYRYRLRARVGQEKVTNLFIYDVLEEAHEGRPHWKGRLTGIDTSRAGAQGYAVRIYGSASLTPGTLEEAPEDWTLLSPDGSSPSEESLRGVKSLAFAFWEESGERMALIPAGASVDVDLLLEVPEEASPGERAYNRIFSRWHALDNYEQPVADVTGISSNTVEVLFSPPVPAEGTLTLRKRVPVSEVHWAYGSPVFFFTVSGLDGEGKTHVYKRALPLTPSSPVSEGYYEEELSLTVPSGTYLVSEDAVMRYRLSRIESVTGGEVQGEKVLLTLDGETVSAGAVFVNTLTSRQSVSDTALAVNHVGP